MISTSTPEVMNSFTRTCTARLPKTQSCLPLCSAHAHPSRPRGCRRLCPCQWRVACRLRREIWTRCPSQTNLRSSVNPTLKEQEHGSNQRGNPAIHSERVLAGRESIEPARRHSSPYKWHH